jgi:hypothetical protein
MTLTEPELVGLLVLAVMVGIWLPSLVVRSVFLSHKRHANRYVKQWCKEYDRG